MNGSMIRAWVILPNMYEDNSVRIVYIYSYALVVPVMGDLVLEKAIQRFVVLPC